MNCLSIKKIIFCLFLFSFSMGSFAIDLNDRSGWYSGFRANYSSNENSCLEENIDCDKTDSGYGIFGGYDFNDRYGVEISWNDIGDSKAKYSDMNLTGELTQADISLMVSHKFAERFSVYGKLGAAFWDGEVTGGPWSLNDSGVRPLLGTGVNISFSKHLSGRVEYQYIDKIGNDEMGFANPNFFGFALVWHFSSPAAPAPEVVSGVSVEPPPQVTPAPQIEEKITLNEEVGGPLFEYNKTEIRNTGAIAPVVTLLLDNPLLGVRVIGHTDAKGSADYNQRLSEERAQAVANYLEARGVAASRITVFGMGEAEPIADNETDVGRAKNRRVEFIVRGTKTQL